jgi:hypothetical protein
MDVVDACSSKRLKLQIILKGYCSAGAVLNKFDLTHVMFAWNGYRVVAPPAALVALITGEWQPETTMFS